MNYNDEYLIINNTYIIKDGFEEDGWYYDTNDHDWHFDVWAMDRY